MEIAVLPPIESLIRDPSRPLVSIVTPSYNQGRFIAETIESVLSQGYPNLEYIVMDGGSTDETGEVCARYADRLTYISEKDRGQSHAINKGFQLARGSIVSWLNSDDIFMPGAIDRAVETMTADPRLGFVYGKGYQIDVDGKEISPFHVAQEFDLWKLVNLSDYVLQQTAFFRRSVFDRLGWLDESLHYGMDWEIFMRIGKAYPVRFLPYDMGAIREHGEAKTSMGGTKRARELARIMRLHGGMRLPPGALIYGIPPYREHVLALIDRAVPPGYVRRKLRNATIRATDSLMRRVLRESEGVYTDGWAGKRAKFIVRAGVRQVLRVSLELPTWLPFDRQSIAVVVDGKTVSRESFGPGSFDFFISLGDRSREGALSVELLAERAFVPSRFSLNGDRRRLCYFVREVTSDEAY